MTLPRRYTFWWWFIVAVGVLVAIQLIGLLVLNVAVVHDQ